MLKGGQFKVFEEQTGCVLWYSVKLKSFNAACWWKNRKYTLLHTVTSGLLAFITFLVCSEKKTLSCEWKFKFPWRSYEMWRGSTGPSAAWWGHQLGTGRGCLPLKPVSIPIYPTVWGNPHGGPRRRLWIHSWSSTAPCNPSGGDGAAPAASTEGYTVCQICSMNFSPLIALSTITNTLCSVNFHPFLAFSGAMNHQPFPSVYWVEIRAFPKYAAACAIPAWPAEGTAAPNASPDGI